MYSICSTRVCIPSFKASFLFFWVFIWLCFLSRIYWSSLDHDLIAPWPPSPLFASPVTPLLQGISLWNVSFKLTLTDRNMQVRFCLKVVFECWDWIFLGITISFQKSNIDWPHQPPTEMLPILVKNWIIEDPFHGSKLIATCNSYWVSLRIWIFLPFYRVIFCRFFCSIKDVCNM